MRMCSIYIECVLYMCVWSEECLDQLASGVFKVEENTCDCKYISSFQCFALKALWIVNWPNGAIPDGSGMAKRCGLRGIKSRRAIRILWSFCTGRKRDPDGPSRKGFGPLWGISENLNLRFGRVTLPGNYYPRIASNGSAWLVSASWCACALRERRSIRV
jgi:hypothetical protein